MIIRIFSILLCLVMVAKVAFSSDILVIEVAGQVSGKVEIELLEEVAPKHVERIKYLAETGAYNNVVFHSVIDGFMAQTGDIEFGNSKKYSDNRVGTGGSDLPDLKAEFNDGNHEKGTCSMARSNLPDSANSQFFICFDSATFLDNQYTIWGQVIEGMDMSTRSSEVLQAVVP